MGARTKSVMEQIFAAMPLDPVRAKALRKAKETGVGDWTQAPASVLLANPNLELLPPSGGFAALNLSCTAAPLSEERKKTAGRSGVEPTIAIWSYEAGHQPNHFKNVSCLVHEDDFKDYVVLDELRFGQVGVECGNEKAWLPLTEDYLFCVAKVGEQDVAARTSELFPLAATYDPSLVYAFLYDVHFELAVVDTPDAPEVTEVKRELHPVHPNVHDPQGWQTLLEAIGEYSDPQGWKPPPRESSSGQGSAAPPGGGPASAAGVPTIQSVLMHDELWDPLPSVSAAEVGKRPVVVQRIPARVLVLVSLTPCREDDDFTPPLPIFGGVAGMARLYPQVMVKCTVPLRRIESTLRSKRPPKTTIRGGHACGCPDMGDAIGALLITDSNRSMINVADPVGPDTPPHWNGLFDYYQTDAHKKFGPTSPLRLVDPDKRYRKVFGVEYEGRDASDLSVDKLARQGAFDNLHLAPKMKFPQAIASIQSRETAIVERVTDLRTKAYWAEALGEVVMAPICAHDCYHAHWRWPAFGSTPSVEGWDHTGPHRKPGAPLVPPHHAVDLHIHSGFEVEVREIAFGHDGTGLPTNEWEIFHHPAYAYAVFTGTFAVPALRMLVAENAKVRFLDENDRQALATESWPVFYFLIRYKLSLRVPFPVDWDDRTSTIRERVRLRAPIEDVME